MRKRRNHMRSLAALRQEELLAGADLPAILVVVIPVVLQGIILGDVGAADVNPNRQDVIYTDNGDGTHSGACRYHATYTIKSEAHRYQVLLTGGRERVLFGLANTTRL